MPYTYEQFPVGTIVRVPRKDPGRWENHPRGSQHFVVVDKKLAPSGVDLKAEIWMRALPEMDGPYFARADIWPIEKVNAHSCFDCGAEFQEVHYLCESCRERVHALHT